MCKLNFTDPFKQNKVDEHVPSEEAIRKKIQMEELTERRKVMVKMEKDHKKLIKK